MLHRGRNGLVVGVGRSNQNCINKNNMCVKSENGMRSKKTSENSLNCQRTTTWGCCWACHHRHLQPTLSHCVMFSHQICGWPEPSTWLRWNSAVTGGVWPPCNVEVTDKVTGTWNLLFLRGPCDHHVIITFHWTSSHFQGEYAFIKRLALHVSALWSEPTASPRHNTG